jgi:putative phosphoribosyl transferase
MFRDRVDAGRHLATVLQTAGIGGEEVVVLGLPRGGVPVAAEVAHRLERPLDVIVVRKLGAPWQPELATGAIGENGVRVENESVRDWTTGHGAQSAAVEAHERHELERSVRRYRAVCARLDLRGRLAVIVDDGIATGSTARAACCVARAQGATRIVLATPVAPVSAAAALHDVCDEFLSVATPETFSAVGEWYWDFRPTSDDEVMDLLRATQP